MKRKLLIHLFIVMISLGLNAQVTRINSNKSLRFAAPLSSSKAIYFSDIDNTPWVSDGTLGGTFQLSTTIQWEISIGSTGFLNGTLIFAGSTPATGTEVYVTDGTAGGTTLMKDINPGVDGSSPGNDVAILNGFIYFTASRPAEGMELWRTNGTDIGTTLVKDIVSGTNGSNTTGKYGLFSNGAYLLFAAQTPASGVELWKSDGTGPGTDVLVNIHTGSGGAASSNPGSFYPFNNVVLFKATDATHGEEIWRTDGTAGGTGMLTDINNGIGSSTGITLFPGFDVSIFQGFHIFNNRAYFRAYDGANTGVLYSTDGTVGNAAVVKDIVPGASFATSISIFNSINLPNKFIFSVAGDAGLAELWESDGTTGGTKVFKAFVQNNPGNIPITFANFAFVNGSFSQPLFQGNKFFFSAATVAEGNELWISDGVDGTVGHTHMVKDINGGSSDGLSLEYLSYIYTTGALYFPASNGTNGVELWKTDGTSLGTSIVQDIILGLDSSKPQINFFIVNGKILFEATDGDDPNQRDLFAVDGNFTPLPISLADFTVLSKSPDAILNWRTLLEINSNNFIIQRSFDGVNFQDIGAVAALGSSSVSHSYFFADVGIMNSGKTTVYYRLRSNDKDGKSTLSPVITLKIKNNGPWGVRLLNNPVKDNLKLMLSGITERVQLSILDMSGKKLSANSFSAINGQISLPANSLPQGTYLLLTEMGTQRKTIQFIK